MEEVERNRIVLANLKLVHTIVADFADRGEYDDLIQIGRVGLVRAVDSYNAQKGPLSAWLSLNIRTAISNELRPKQSEWYPKEGDLDLIEEGEPDTTPPPARIDHDTGSNSTERVYQWQRWGSEGNANALIEHWIALTTSPEELTLLFAEIADCDGFQGALIGLSGLERKLIELVFLGDTRMNLQDAARAVRISYYRTLRTLKKALRKLREVLVLQKFNVAEVPQRRFG